MGAPYEDGGDGDPLSDAGAAYMFFHTGGNLWSGETKINASDAQTEDLFGRSVSLWSDYAIIGAVGEDGGAGDPLPQAGAAYIFHRTGMNTWRDSIKIFAFDARGDDLFGYAVSIGDDFALVGALWEDGGITDPLVDTGAAYVYD